MCGRFSIDTDSATVRQQFKAESFGPLPVSSNVAPTENALCVIKSDEGLIALPLRWGIIPWYKKDKKPPLLINARAESVAEKPAFKQSLKYRRCLVLMSGFFEWSHHEKTPTKQPFFISSPKKELLAVAALWDTIKLTKNMTIPACCLLTVDANPSVTFLHDRMPWILTPDEQQDWLNPEEFREDNLNCLLENPVAESLISYPVTPKMNSALYKEKDCIKPLLNDN